MRLPLLTAHTVPDQTVPNLARPRLGQPGHVKPRHIAPHGVATRRRSVAKALSAVYSPRHVTPRPTEPCHSAPRPATPDLAGPHQTLSCHMVSPPHSRLSQSGYRLFTALDQPRHATLHLAAPGPKNPYLSALDAMPVSALTFAIASMFARRCSSVSSKCRRLRSLLPAVRNTLRALDSNSFTATPVCS